MKMLFGKISLITILLVRASTAYSVRPRITNGVTADREQYRFMASLFWRFLIFVPPTHYCAAVVIHEYFLLGSAHCVSQMPILGKLRAKLGKYHLRSDDEHVRIFVVRKIIMHEHYKGKAGPNDLVLLMLETAITFNRFIKKVNLPPVNVPINDMGILVGWGSISTTTKEVWPVALEAALVPIINSMLCENAILKIEEPIELPRYIHHTQICTDSFEEATSVCVADAGGPLLQYREKDEPELIGIISWGMYPCGQKQLPSVHTRITSFRDWIDKRIEENMLEIEV